MASYSVMVGFFSWVEGTKPSISPSPAKALWLLRMRRPRASEGSFHLAFLILLFFGISDKEIQKTREINQNIYIDLDKYGNLVSMTIEHAKQNAGLTEFSYQEIISKSA